MEERMPAIQQRQLLQLSRTMNRLRQEERLTDVVLMCEEQRFPANKVVLAASTPFFAEMFESNASDNNFIKLRSIPAEIMKILMEFMYTGDIALDATEAPKLIEVVKAAHELQLNILVDHCLKNFLQLLSCADILQLMRNGDKNAELKVQLTKHLAQNIFKARDADALHELPLDCFVDILSSEELCAESDDALHAILTWVSLDKPQRLKDIKFLLPLVDPKGVSDNFLFEIQQTDLFPMCPDLIKFTFDIMMPRYRSLSSLRGSSCSLFSESSESNDVAANDENDELALEKQRPNLISSKSVDSKKSMEVVSKAAAVVGKDGDALPTIKEEPSILGQKSLASTSTISKPDHANQNRGAYDCVNQKSPIACAALPETKANIPISTSPPVKDTSPASTPTQSASSNLVNASDAKKALEMTPLLLAPNLVLNRNHASCSPALVNKATPLTEAVKPKEISAKPPQRTVANLALLTVGKKQANTLPRQSNNASRQQYNGGPSQPNLFRGPIDKPCRVDSDRSQYGANNHFGDKNGNSDDLFSRCTAAIRNHEANRSFGPNRSTDRNSSFDKNSREPTHSRDPVRTQEPNRGQDSARHEPDHARVEPKRDETSTESAKSSQSGASKNRLPVTVASSKQVESSKDVFFVLQTNNHEWSLETFSTETDEWSLPKVVSTDVYRNSAVVGVGHVIYFFGGTTDTWDVLKTALMYNTQTNEWRKVADMQVARWGAGGAQLKAYVYAVGGVSEVNTRLNHVERYSPLSDTWSSVAPLSTCREQPSVTSVNDKLYVIGGYVILPQQWQMRTIETKSTATGEIYNPATDQWTSIDTPLSIGREVLDKTFCTTALTDRLFAMRANALTKEAPHASPVLFEYSLEAKQWYRHTISDPELMTVVHICSITNDQLCLVSGKGNVYVFQSNDGTKELLKCSDVEKKGMVFAVIPCASK